VKIDLIVRGICALRPGVRGVSENIHVRSIVGRFLEHSRIYFFGNGGEEEIYIGSSDWMPRNLYERVEVLVPLRDEMLRERVRHEILDAFLADNRKSRILLKDATYIRAWQSANGKRDRRPPVGAASFSAQDFLIGIAEGKAQAAPPAPSERGKSGVRGKRQVVARSG
jgi:polyphosphate kinase